MSLIIRRDSERDINKLTDALVSAGYTRAQLTLELSKTRQINVTLETDIRVCVYFASFRPLSLSLSLGMQTTFSTLYSSLLLSGNSRSA